MIPERQQQASTLILIVRDFCLYLNLILCLCSLIDGLYSLELIPLPQFFCEVVGTVSVFVDLG